MTRKIAEGMQNCVVFDSEEVHLQLQNYIDVGKMCEVIVDKYVN